MKKEFTFIDLFAGIGGTRIAFEKAGGMCVFSSENNKWSQETYEANFGERPEGDITKISEKDIPDHDILVGGFPCQPFSLAGVSSKKHMGRPHGFDARTTPTKKNPLGETQGTLFFDIARIIREKRPRAFLLENVKSLKGHDKGNTFRVIKKVLMEDLGYDVHYKIVDASSVVPQHRERIFIVGFRKPMDFEFPKLVDMRPKLVDVLEKRVDPKYTLTDGTWKSLQRHKEKHRAKGNGFGYTVADKNKIANTLSARYWKDGAEILIDQGKKNPRKLTPRECARIMGFSEKYRIVVSDTQAYRQFGNAVVVPVVTEIAKSIVQVVKSNNRRRTIVDYV
jgi:DNA (cytosine-5)-methyltransferase 1